MSVESRAVVRHARSPWHFTLGGALFFTAAVAVLMAAFQARGGTLAELPRAALLGFSVLLMGGLLVQARDLLHAAGEEELSPPARAGYRFAALWRIGMVVVLIAYHGFEWVDARRLAAVRGSFGWWIDLVYCLSLVTIAASTRQVAQRWQRWSTPFFLLLLWVFSVVCFAVGLFEQLKAHGALRAYRTMGYLRASSAGPESAAWLQSGFWLTVCWSLLLPLAFGSIYFVARGSASRWRRVMYASLFGASFGASSLILLWHVPFAWTAMVPYARADPANGNLLHFLRVAGPFLLILTTAVAYRWSARSSLAVAAFPDTARANAGTYAHENRVLLLLLAALLALDVVVIHWRTARELLKYAEWNSATSVVGLIFSLESALPLVATSLIVLHAGLAGGRKRAASRGAVAGELPLKRFLGVWAAIMATTLVALLTMTLAGTTYWLNSLTIR